MRLLLFPTMVSALACSTTVQPPGRVPGEDRVFYDGQRDVREVAIAIAVWRIVRDEIMAEVPSFSGLRIVEADEAEAGDEIGPYRGMCPAPDRCVIERTERISDGVLFHELTHAWLWQLHKDPDSSIELGADGRCLSDGNGACSHEGGGGPWTMFDDKVIGDANEALRWMGL